MKRHVKKRTEREQRAAEERAKRAKERRKRAIVQQEVEVAKKRRHLNLSSDGVADIHFSETSTSTSTGKVEDMLGTFPFGSNSPGAFPPVL